MNQHLQNILNLIQQAGHLTDEEKTALSKAAKAADKELEITSFKLQRTEKVKHTTAILLEETIEELEQKRNAVEVQNRELEIESALERVRTVAMSMIKPDDLLSICKTQFIELQQLGFTEIRNTLIGIFHDEKKHILDYDFSDFSGGRITKIPYHKNPVIDNYLKQMKSASDAFTEFIVEGKALQDWKDFRKQNGEYDDTRLENLDAVYYYFYSIGSGSVGVSTFKKINEEQLSILKRFRNVFDLAYRRYVDITNAEAQTKEARIETALERVRAVAMAMRKSEEVINVCEVMYKELLALGFTNIRNAQIALKDPDKRSYLICVYSDNEKVALQEAPFNSSPLVKDLYDELEQSKDAFYQREFSGKQFEDWRKWRESLYALSDREATATSVCFYLYSIGTGHLGISTFNPITDEPVEILKRFKNVFELSYRRYTDVAQAEAQARESQIQLALERVRARTMAMQKSEELSETVFILFQQFKELGENPDQATIGIINEDEWVIEYWVTMYGNQTNRVYKFSIDEPNVTNRIYNAWKDKKKSLAIDLSGKQLYDFANYRESMGGAVYNPEEKRRVINVAFFSKGIINVQSNESRSTESISLLERFAAVFEQTYTRFLDLQKAEAQAREAQIEVSLERVRANAMAMHRSDELSDVLTVLFEQFDVLNIRPVDVHLDLFDLEKNTFSYRATGKEGKRVIAEQIVDLDSRPEWQALVEKWKNGKLNTVDFSFYPKEVIGALMAFFPDIWAAMPEDAIMSPEDFPDGIFDALAYCKFGYIGMHHHRKATEEEQKILIRFANEFERLYQRFLDLQKAEAQAREAQIELALERVRARTMAMQQSNELSETATLLFKQIQDLGIQAWSTGFNVWQENDTYCLGYNTGPDGKIGDPLPLPLTEDVFFKTIYNAKKRGEDFLVFESEGESLVQTYSYMDNLPVVGDYMRSIVASGFELPKYQVTHCGFFPQGHLMFITLEPHLEVWDIFRRFTKVFEQTYTRFLDLQKAEAQAREAEIEVSLERVRSRSMAMHKSDELLEAGELLWHELTKLGIESLTSGYVLIDGDEKIGWTYAPDPKTGKIFAEPLGIDQTKTKEMLAVLANWKKQEVFSVIEMNEQETIAHQTFVAEQSLNLDGTICNWITAEHLISLSPKRLFLHNFNFKQGYLMIVGGNRLTQEQIDLMLRFTIVFQQTYTRFLDLQKAEAQAREAQIEASLERVRSRTMAMQRSDELLDVATVLFQQVKALGVPQWNCGFNIWNIGDKEFTYYPGSPDGIISPSPCKIPLTEHPVFKLFDESRKRGDELLVYEKEGEEQADHYRYMLTLPGVGDFLRSMLDAGFELPKFQIDHLANFSYGNLLFITYEHFPEMHEIFKRFAKVFEQTYTRFLDLQKAEKQAREAQIEASLERVRSKTMAMHNSQDVGDTVSTMFAEFVNLRIYTNRCGILIFNSKDSAEVWTARSNPEGKATLIIGRLDLNSHKLLSSVYVAWKAKESFYQYDLLDDDLKRYYESINKSEYYQIKFDIESLPSKEFHSDFFFPEGAVFAFTSEPVIEEHSKIIKRFAGVFGQTYRRYLDLQKAEAQTREAEIELGLERVRARAMAMQTSEELNELIGTVFTELTKLDLTLTRCVIVIFEGHEKGVRWWMANSEAPSTPMNFFVDYADMPFFNEHLKAWSERKLKWQYTLDGENKVKTDDFLFNHTELSQLPHFVISGMREPDRVYLNVSFNNFGNLTLASLDQLSNEQFDILLRFAKVFDLTYTRFNDLQKAEAQAREAQIEAGLERVRSRTMAMQTSNELAETAAVVFKQLINLGIAPNRLYIGIIRDESGNIEFWVTDEDGSKVSTQFTGNVNSNASMRKMYEGWMEQKKSLTIDMQGTELQNYFHYLADELHVPFKDGLSQKRRVQTIAYFSKGFIGMASPDEQPGETTFLLERFAGVFNLTFTRFNDLKIAEAHALQAEEDLIKLQTEKKRAEDALTELQATQKQLIQSEKMASLGELTAGIAHEIQNPLNFVNNFSEVNKELLAEMNEEIDKGNYGEVKAIASDVIDNEEKINHHGKRADAIVKGMLQHSRSSSGQKEPTDINALADEYLRLAYHGLRAKDKSFNATMKTGFDISIGKINIIPQDIGRMILNLITNAFYAVDEKKKQQPEGYEPTVSVSTKKTGDKIELTVRDNGNGIPQKVLDKIFQPFFTTKPTGQGTGLGLSLSYDIIKAHGGEIKVETKKDEGSKFIVVLAGS